MLNKGFYTALGTPLDQSGHIITESLQKQIEDQIAAGASGLLLFGTMGIGGCIKNDEFEKGIKAAVSAVNKRCTLLVGASENSLARVADKMEIVNRYDVNGVVLTAPYYLKTSDAVLENFFAKTAGMTDKDYYLYDHQPITKHKITYPMMKNLMRISNVKGIKSGDLVLIKYLTDTPEKEDFTPIFSGSDLFDVAHAYGICRYLDGIFACMPKSIANVQKHFNSGDIKGGKCILDNMMNIRDIMIGLGIWPAFSCAMNLLGYEGSFIPDYEADIDDNAKKIVENGLCQLGEL